MDIQTSKGIKSAWVVSPLRKECYFQPMRLEYLNVRANMFVSCDYELITTCKDDAFHQGTIFNETFTHSFTGKDDPKAPTMHIKPKDPKSFVTPSPGAYNPDLADKDVKESAPKFSFGMKPKDEKPKAGPGILSNLML